MCVCVWFLPGLPDSCFQMIPQINTVPSTLLILALETEAQTFYLPETASIKWWNQISLLHFMLQATQLQT